MCEIANRQAEITELLAAALQLPVVSPALWDYALLVEATATPLDRAIIYLKDCQNKPEHATGRLLLRAAERALRAGGE